MLEHIKEKGGFKGDPSLLTKSTNSKSQEEFEVGQKLGEGSNGKVVLIKMKDTGDHYAMKIFTNNEKWPTAKTEAEVLKRLQHQNIIQYYRRSRYNGNVRFT